MAAKPAAAAAVAAPAASSSPAPPFDLSDPSELFEVLAKLGEGSYGSVYKALDKRDGKLVAIKVLEVENEDTIELQKEINILRECDCEWIVRYKGSYRKDGNIWIVMEVRSARARTAGERRTPPWLSALAGVLLLTFAFHSSLCSSPSLSPLSQFCGAGSLCDLMAICERTLTEEQIAIVLKQSLYGLEYLHAKRKIHRDIKSGNILINHDGDCKARTTHDKHRNTLSQGTSERQRWTFSLIPVPLCCVGPI